MGGFVPTAALHLQPVHPVIRRVGIGQAAVDLSSLQFAQIFVRIETAVGTDFLRSGAALLARPLHHLREHVVQGARLTAAKIIQRSIIGLRAPRQIAQRQILADALLRGLCDVCG